MELRGYGTLLIGRSTKCLQSEFCFDFDSGNVIVKINSECSKIKNISAYSDKRYSCEDVVVHTVFGKINLRKRLSLYFKQLGPCSFSAFELKTFKLANIGNKNYGIISLMFSCQEDIIEAITEKDYHKSELVFGNSILDLHSFSKIRVDGHELELFVLDDIIAIQSDEDILKYKDALCRFFSILQGGRVYFKIGVGIGNLLQMKISKQRHVATHGFGLPFHVLEPMFQVFISYERRLTDFEFNRHVMSIEYFCESSNSQIPNEAKLINLFTCIEAISDSETLDKNKLSNFLEISPVVAEFLIKVRNKIIHEGLKVIDAIESVEMYVRLYKREVVFKENKNRDIQLYEFLLFKVYKTLCDRMNLYHKDLSDGVGSLLLEKILPEFG